ncbi:MAG: hypothetical protein R3B13_22430 [Polyangiaceae bacterium]
MPAPNPATIVVELERHAALDTMCSLVREHLLGKPADEQARLLSDGVELESVSAEGLQTEWGNLREILRTGPQSKSASALVAAVVALAIRVDFPSAPEQESARARELIQLTTHRGVDALGAIDAALKDGAGAFWAACANVMRELTPAETMITALALRRSSHPAAGDALTRLTAEDIDPNLAAILATAPADVSKLSGELTAAPRHPAITVLLAVSGILFLMALGRALGRLALAYRKPAEVVVSERGIEISYRTELLGRVLRDRSTLVPLTNVAKLTREVRFARAGLYAGLIALCLGTYFGMGLLVDGSRVPGTSPPLLGLGVVIIGLGLALDFGFSLLADRSRGHCRMVVVPLKGRSVCIGSLDRARVDAMLDAVAKLARSA